MTDQPLWDKIKGQSYCDPSRRMDFVFLFDVRDGNPNGDPDAGNLPRMDPTDRHGIVTDVCIKRKVRDYLAGVLGRDIYVQSQTALNTLYFREARKTDEAKGHVVEVPLSANEIKALSGPGTTMSDEGIDAVRRWLSDADVEGLEFQPESEKVTYFGEAKTEANFKQLLAEDKPPDIPETVVNGLAKALAAAKKKLGGAKLSQDIRDKVKTQMCAAYDDIRLFGAVLTAGTNAGQVRGPMQITFGRSLQEILPQDAAITRCAITREADRARKQTEFGRKPWLSYAAYRQHGFYNAPLGAPRPQGTGVTREDLARFWEALAGMFPNSASASKGEMATRDLVVFVHSNARGDHPSHRLLECVSDGKKDNHPVLDVTPEKTQMITSLGIEVMRPLRDLWGVV